MTNTTPTTTAHSRDREDQENSLEQAQEDHGDSSGPPAQPSNAGSSDKRRAPGRKPLFGT
jgi:hypothetical protein